MKNMCDPNIHGMIFIVLLQVYLQVVRLYGSLNKVETQYRATGVTAENKFDFITVENHAVVMEEGQTSGLIPVDVRMVSL